jgi:hypothetical protein
MAAAPGSKPAKNWWPTTSKSAHTGVAALPAYNSTKSAAGLLLYVSRQRRTYMTWKWGPIYATGANSWYVAYSLDSLLSDVWAKAHLDHIPTFRGHEREICDPRP